MQNGTSEMKVVKDMSEDYILKLSTLLGEIDYLKKLIVSDPEYIVNLEERVHALFVLLSRKMNSNELFKQYQMRRKILSIPVLRKKRIPYQGTAHNQYRIDRTHFQHFRQLLEMREISLHKVMEYHGLTATSKPQRVKLG